MIYEIERESMVRHQIVGRGIEDPRVIDAMLAVPRECFVPEESHGLAHEDHPLAIGHGQTISQPYIVALMTELLRLPAEGAKVLEIGAGSGYQTAILAHIAGEVCAMERNPEGCGKEPQKQESAGFEGKIVETCGETPRSGAIQQIAIHLKKYKSTKKYNAKELVVT